MGCASSSEMEDQGTPEERRQNEKIEAELKKARTEMKTQLKMLLLGAGESGKSTFVKQMKLLYAEPYSLEDREAFKEVAIANTIQSMQAVIRGFESLSVPLPSHLLPFVNLLLELDTDDVAGSGMEDMNPEVAKAISKLWADSKTKDVVAMSSQYQLNDSAPYFFDALERIAEPGYLPSDDDILRTRVRSTGIVEARYRVKGNVLRVFDVGGQRSERKKWIHCFEDVDILCFVAAINEYDQTLWEDESTNRLEEAMTLFKSTSTSQIDIFREKLHHSPLRDFFPDYTGGTSFEPGAAFMKEKFLSLDNAGGRRIYTHLTCATDSGQTRVVLAAVLDQVVGNMLRDAILL
ncbi:guanine nucleotide-binding protein subunit alpha [Pseudohyphozyma bogoriensis]|nr:guanine nucleotide-binding protein subunit alpha [Pseudohyphozyma bogoriensis]